MPYILFKTYYKYGEWQSSIVATEEALLWEAEGWLQDNNYPVPEDKTLGSMIATLLKCGQKTISNEAGWGYVQIYEVPSISRTWGPSSGSK